MAKILQRYGGGKGLEVPKSITTSVMVSRAGTSPPFYKSQKIKVMHDFDDLRKRDKFTITDTEVAYWRKIHDLNTPSIERKQKPLHIAEYLLQFVELMEAKG